MLCLMSQLLTNFFQFQTARVFLLRQQNYFFPCVEQLFYFFLQADIEVFETQFGHCFLLGEIELVRLHVDLCIAGGFS